MKFHRSLLCLISAIVVILSTVTAAFAEDNPVDKLRVALEKAGIPAEQTGKVIEYLQKVNISSAQADTIINKIDEVQSKIDGQNDLSKLSISTRDEIKSIMVDTVDILGLTADLSRKNTQGATVLTLLDKDGSALVSTSSTAAVDQIKNFDINTVKEAVIQAEVFSNNPDKNKFYPVTGAPMKNTGTNYGNLIVLGLLMVIAGISMMVFRRKLFNI